MMQSPKSIRKKRTQHKVPGLPFPNYYILEDELPVVCTCVYDGSKFLVHSTTDIQILFSNGSFGRSTLTLRTPLCSSNNLNYQYQPYYQKSQLGTKTVAIENFKVPPVISTADVNGEPLAKKSKVCTAQDEGHPEKEDAEDVPGTDSEMGVNTEDAKESASSQKERIIFEEKGPLLSKSDDFDTDEKLELLPEEVIFLSFAAGCLKIENEQGEKVGYESLWNMLVEKDPEFPIFYAVYHHFRSKNWVPKSGQNYGGDFVLYEAGPEYYHSLYIVHILGLKSRPRPVMMEVCALQRCASHASKFALLCEVTAPDGFVPKSPKSVFDLRIREMPIYRWAPHLYSQ